jgi:hypothetical protein
MEGRAAVPLGPALARTHRNTSNSAVWQIVPLLKSFGGNGYMLLRGSNAQ